MKYLMVLLLLVCSMAIQAEKTKQALKAFEKQDYEKAEEILIKSNNKDSLNPGTAYVWALLYADIEYPKFNVDTAHIFIQLSLQYLEVQNEDHLDELDDADIFENDLKNKNLYLDSLGFVQSTQAHSIDRYKHFIKLYAGAAEINQAIELRNQLIYEQVEKQNSWQAYKQFLNAYPLATQVSKAQVKYDQLIYEDLTSSGNIRDLEIFLKKEPTTPFRHSIEKRIFEVYISTLDTDRIMYFIKSYQNELLTKRALGILYHLDDFDFMSMDSKYQAFKDSVSRLEILNKIPLIIQYANHKYTLTGFDGVPIIKEEFEDVNFNYLCGNVTTDWLEVKSDNVRRLINRKGHVIDENVAGDVKDLGSGLLAVQKNQKYGLIHKAGFQLLSFEYDNLELLANKVIAFWKDGKVGTMGISGEIFLPAVYDEIHIEADFWVFEQDEFFGVSNIETVLNNSLENAEKVQVSYEEVELIDNKFMIGYVDEREVLLNINLEIISPKNTKRINTRYDTWLLDLADGFTTFDPGLAQVSSNIYPEVRQNKEWLGLKKNGKWFVYNKNIYDEPIVGIDSLKLLGKDIAIVFRDDSGMAIFPNKNVVDIIEGEYLRSIGSLINSKVHFLVVKRRGRNILYRDGEKLFDYECDQLGYISDSAFFVKKEGKYGAVGLDGRLIMRVRYDAISEAANEVASVLYKGKFGAYNFRDRFLLRLDYEEKLKSYNKQLFLVRENDKYGILNNKNMLLIEPAYEEIKYWSDSSFLGKDDGKWSVVDITTGESNIDNIEYYEYLKNTAEEKILLIRKEEGYGVYHSSKGIIVPPVFHDVFNLGNDEVQLYFAETAVPEADIYVVVYYDTNGNKISSEAYRGDEYELIVCEE